MKSILVCGLLCCLIGSITFIAGQERGREERGTEQNTSNDQIEVKTDKFSNDVTVLLKPLVILDKPNHRLTIEIETKLKERDVQLIDQNEVEAKVIFRSLYTDVDFGDQELHFMINNKPLNLGKSSGGTPRATSEEMRKQQGFRLSTFFISIFNRRAFEEFSKANSVEMRLGTIESTLNQTTIAPLREYAKEVLAQKQKITKARKL